MVIVIGTGAGGSLIAMELAKANIPVTIIERGPYIKSKDSFEYYDMKYYDKRLKNTNSIDLLKTTCIGGSTIVAAGNGVRLLEDEFKELGIDISAEYDKIEELVGCHFQSKMKNWLADLRRHTILCIHYALLRVA